MNRRLLKALRLLREMAAAPDTIRYRLSGPMPKARSRFAREAVMELTTTRPAPLLTGYGPDEAEAIRQCWCKWKGIDPATAKTCGCGAMLFAGRCTDRGCPAARGCGA